MKLAPLLALFLASPLSLQAAGPQPSPLKIGHPYSYPTAAPGITAVGYLSITNTGKTTDTLLAVSSPAASSVEIHQMKMSGGIMQMRALTGGTPIAPKATLNLAPGGFHLMLFSPSQALVLGQQVPVTLTFARAGKLTVQLAVEARPEDEEAHPHH